MLNDLETAVTQCIIMRLREKEALAYLKSRGHEMQKSKYWSIRGRLKAQMRKRLHEIGQVGFEEQHLWRIDQLELVEQEFWKCYVMEPSPFRKAGILRHIAEIQPYLATFYDLTRKVIENQKPIETNYSLPELASELASEGGQELESRESDSIG